MSKKSAKISTISKKAIVKPSSQPNDSTTEIVHSFKHSNAIQNFILVWLDEHITADCHHLVDQLKLVANTIEVFNDVDQCANFLNNAQKKVIFLVVSDRLDQRKMSRIHEINSLASIFILCNGKSSNESWTKELRKIRGEYTNMTDLCRSLKATAREIDEDFIAISFLSTTEIANQSLDELDQSFMYTLLIKEILLQLQYNDQSIRDLVNYCRKKYTDDNNVDELKHVNKLEREYGPRSPIWWYSNECFIYSMLNRALHEQDFASIIRMGFFIHDLHEQITKLHAEQTVNKKAEFQVFRGHGISRIALKKLTKTEGGLIAFNNFLSTSHSPTIAQEFVERALKNPQSAAIFFRITVDPSISSAPFASVGNLGCFNHEKEVLFSMHAVFRVERIEQDHTSDRVWNINLKLTSDNDKQLNRLSVRMREEIEGTTPLYRLGALMIRLGDFKKAEEVYNQLDENTSDQLERAHLFYQLGFIKYNQGNNQEANLFYQKALEIYLQKLSPGHKNIASTYNNMGLVCDSMSDYSQALKFYKKARKIYEKELASDDPVLATCYNNIASAYDNSKEYEQALIFYKKAFQIYDKKLPSNHPHVATYHSNIGLVYFHMQQYSEASTCLERAVYIGRKTLPADHPDLEVYRKNLESVRKKLNK
jgi:tetratricopeptide (TPR) repeat protein